MSKNSSIVAIFSEFLTRYQRHFGMLFLLLVVEGAVSALSVMALVPLADFMVDPALAKPSRITQVVIDGLGTIGSHPTFWILGGFFVLTNFLKGLLDVAIRYAILRIKYAVIRGLFGDDAHSGQCVGRENRNYIQGSGRRFGVGGGWNKKYGFKKPVGHQSFDRDSPNSARGIAES